MTYNYNNPKIWSSHYWFVLHTIGLNYPLNPNNVCKKKYSFPQSEKQFVTKISEPLGSQEKIL